MQNIIFKSFGCKVNQLEHNALRVQFLTQKCTEVEDFILADMLIISSCSVTHSAESKLIKYVRKGLRANKNLRVKIFGCFLESLKTRLNEFADRVEFANNTDKFDFLGTTMPYVLFLSEKTRTFIKIQEGCNAFCSYCIIPHLRSQLFSRPTKDIITNIKQCIESNIKEIVLVGINLGLWSDENLTKKSGTKFGFTDLLDELSEIVGNWRLRLSSIEVSDLTSDLIKIIGKNNKIVPHLHISVQSGSSRIIKNMNRKYTKEDIIEKIANIRSVLPLAGLSADFIVGFPGETEQDFQDTLHIIEQGEFIRVHIFPYSSRPGTKAASFTNKVQPAIIKHREKILLHKCTESRNKFLKKFINREVTVLVEEIQNKQAKGYSAEYIPTIINDANPDMLNNFITRIVQDLSVKGELILTN